MNRFKILGSWKMFFCPDQRELRGFTTLFRWTKTRFPNTINCEASLFPHLHSTIYAHTDGHPFRQQWYETFWCSDIISISDSIQITYQSGIVGLRRYLKKLQPHRHTITTEISHQHHALPTGFLDRWHGDRHSPCLIPNLHVYVSDFLLLLNTFVRTWLYIKWMKSIIFPRSPKFNSLFHKLSCKI